MPAGPSPRPHRARATALVLAAVLGLYLVVLAQRGLVLVSTGSLVPVLLGVGMLLLPVVGAVVRPGVAYDAGDRRRARVAMRRAITLHRSGPT